MPDKTPTTISFTDGRGKEQTRVINHVIDIRDYRGTPGYSMLVVAANRNLSGPDIEKFLWCEARDLPWVERSLTWIKRRRWMFQPPDTDNTRDRDRNYAWAVKIMQQYPTHSVRGLARILKKHGITRSSEWCRKHRCDPVE
jgi:hypothetical protein